MFERKYPEGITPRAITLNKMTSSAYPMIDAWSVENELGYVASYYEFNPQFFNSPAFIDLHINHVMMYKSIDTIHHLRRMAKGLRYEPYPNSFGKHFPQIEAPLEEAGVTYLKAIAKTKLISFGDLGESSVYRYKFSQQGGGSYSTLTQKL